MIHLSLAHQFLQKVNNFKLKLFSMLLKVITSMKKNLVVIQRNLQRSKKKKSRWAVRRKLQVRIYKDRIKKSLATKRSNNKRM